MLTFSIARFTSSWTLAPLDAFEFGNELQVALHRHFGIQRRILRQVSDPPANFERLIRNIEAVHFYGAVRARHVTGDDPHCCCFAGAVRTQKSQDLALLHAKGHSLDGRLCGVSFGQVFNGNHYCR